MRDIKVIIAENEKLKDDLQDERAETSRLERQLTRAKEKNTDPLLASFKRWLSPQLKIAFDNGKYYADDLLQKEIEKLQKEIEKLRSERQAIADELTILKKNTAGYETYKDQISLLKSNMVIANNERSAYERDNKKLGAAIYEMLMLIPSTGESAVAHTAVSEYLQKLGVIKVNV